MADAPLLELRNLVTEFRTETGTVQAVKGVDLVVEPGKTVAVVGESGSAGNVGRAFAAACRAGAIRSALPTAI